MKPGTGKKVARAARPLANHTVIGQALKALIISDLKSMKRGVSARFHALVDHIGLAPAYVVASAAYVR